jgi:hypothetical protein
MKYPCVLKNALLIIRDRSGLSFATKRIGLPCCTFSIVTTYFLLQIALLSNYLLPIISVLADQGRAHRCAKCAARTGPINFVGPKFFYRPMYIFICGRWPLDHSWRWSVTRRESSIHVPARCLDGKPNEIGGSIASSPDQNGVKFKKNWQASGDGASLEQN